MFRNPVMGSALPISAVHHAVHHAPPRLLDTPTQAYLPDVQLVAAPCVTMHDDQSWREYRVNLVSAGDLHPLEASLADLLPPPRRSTFVGGRVAMRQALRRAHTDPASIPPVLRSMRGAPLLPPGVAGSISHKKHIALAAVVPRRGALRHVGVDLELRPTASDLERPSIASRVLTDAERGQLYAASTDELERRERTLVHFAIKEAVYKAIDPFVERYVGFSEVELAVGSAHAEVTLLLPELSEADVQVHAHWHVDGPWIVASAVSYR
jgi:enterobactin synthetase component D